MEDRKVLRRSPGMASSSAMLRRSPRMVSSSANMGQTLPSSSFGGSVKETHLPSLGHGSSMEGKKDLRRSPRMASSSANMWRPVLSSSTDNSVKETSSPNVGHGSSRVDCKLLRRSPRMVSSSANMGQTMPSSRTDGLVKEASLPNVGSGSSMEGKKELRRSPRMVSWSANIGQTMASLSTDVSVEETSLPNVSCGSSMEGKKELRRSPRMLSRSLNIGQTKPSLSTDGSIKETSLPNVGHGSSMESKKELRRSPRMLSRSLNIGQTKPSLSTDGSVKETSLPNVGHGSSMESKKELRRSPRNASYFENFGQNKLSSSIEHSGTALSLPNLGHVSSMDYKKALRRSPRIVLCSEKSGKNRRSLSTDSSVKVDSSPDSVCEVYQRRVKKQKVGEKVTNEECRLIGAPVDLEEAHNRWPWRYNVEKSGRNSKKNWSMDSDELILDVRCHYLQADICGHKFNLGDTAYVKGQKGGPNYIGRILEFFETMDGIQYFNAQWFFRAADTVIQGLASQHDKKRIFYSDLKNDNLLDCIVSKIKIVQVTPNVNLAKRKSIPPCDFYYDMSYSIPYSTFSNILSETSNGNSDSLSSVCTETGCVSDIASKSSTRKASRSNEPERTELTLLDLFCGCGGMSTGLSLGAKLSGVNLVTRWALDLNESACQSLKLNHPETEVRNESAEEFFELLKAWEKLCKQYCPSGVEKAPSRGLQSDGNPKEDSKIPSGEYEVSHFVGIRYGDHIESGKRGLMFKPNTVAYDEDQPRNLKDAVLLGDAISDLPTVTNFETRDEMPYGKPPQTEFQRYIRATKHEMMGTAPSSVKRSSHKPMLYDHRPLLLNEDDHQRVCQIPKRKGANFRDLPGVVVGADNKVEWDPKIKRVLLPSGKPLVPDYAMSHLNGKSSKPFARLWWDETVPTVLTRAPPHNQAILHPVQDRVLTVRESGRLQGFPDYYKLCGSVRDRYMQVGNAVAVPVAMALGYAMGLAYRGLSSNDPLITLPTDFPLRRPPSSSSSSEVE
ncbi:DNA (cytosine-5)-methyltransferase CMT2 isoform X5 [Amborella trichopoda]|uniref:DNA (cytosine-5)-methyltransferase CMT2 isoform X5 n=1 Tax=Amborella trichopoda TaxID=13333 RepID=UPI0009BFBB70|nr:DNA (cytosine-5)-methyltransferase CMT2 isoform X5 [Amborella trichopoda]|eukprot:XP_020528965.1 DNA (cytosine-5)-methyltransferase CMT2 isoform X5 [Amborella trichopoda]